MASNSTHSLTIKVGLDLTKILSPESVAGVMAYLGVENVQDLLEAVAIDQNKRATEALEKNGFEIISSKFESLQVMEDQQPKSDSATISPKPSQDSDNESESVNNTDPENNAVGEEPEVNDTVNYLMGSILNDIQKIKNDHCEIQAVEITKTLEEDGPDADAVRALGNLSTEVDVSYIEMEPGELAAISFLTQDGEISFKEIKEGNENG